MRLNTDSPVTTALCLTLLIGLSAVSVPSSHASELVTLKNGFDLVSDHRENIGGRVRLYTSLDSSNFVEFALPEIASIEPMPNLTKTLDNPPASMAVPRNGKPGKPLTSTELHQMLATAGTQHNIDVDLLASVVHAESGGNVRAVSRCGARGLMQLMPRTAAQLGVTDSFRPEENIRRGADYLNSLLVRYRDNLALALAAYNAGPAAVARWHGVPPYRDTRVYVARIIREFNTRRPASSAQSTTALASFGSRSASALKGAPFTATR